jgi:acid phosphatase family membrane protein YuiD
MAEDDSSNIAEPRQARPGEEGTPDAVRTRQGVTGHGVRYVLAASLIGIVVAFILVVYLAR